LDLTKEYRLRGATTFGSDTQQNGIREDHHAEHSSAANVIPLSVIMSNVILLKIILLNVNLQNMPNLSFK
jgi:hypothetical protein